MQNVAIFGTPRSGTSWLGQLFNSSPSVAYRYQPLFSYAFKDYLNLESDSSEIDSFHEAILNSDDPFVNQSENVSGNESPHFQKGIISHLVWKEVRYLHLIEHLLLNSNIKIIGIVRNPCSVLYSWFKAPKEFNPEWDFASEWKDAPLKNKSRVEEFFGYNKWIEATNMLLRLSVKYPNRLHVLSYESLNQDTLQILESTFSFCGLELTPQTIDFVNDSKSKTTEDPYDVYRKNKSNVEWLGKLDDDIVRFISNDDAYKSINEHFQWEMP